MNWRQAEIDESIAREDARARTRTAILFDLSDTESEDVRVQCIGCKWFFAERDLKRRGSALYCPTCLTEKGITHAGGKDASRR